MRRESPAGLSAAAGLPGLNATSTGRAAARSLSFSRDTQAPDSGEFFVWHEQGPEDWPPACPPSRSARP